MDINLLLQTFPLPHTSQLATKICFSIFRLTNLYDICWQYDVWLTFDIKFITTITVKSLEISDFYQQNDDPVDKTDHDTARTDREVCLVSIHCKLDSPRLGQTLHHDQDKDELLHVGHSLGDVWKVGGCRQAVHVAAPVHQPATGEMVPVSGGHSQSLPPLDVLPQPGPHHLLRGHHLLPVEPREHLGLQ